MKLGNMAHIIRGVTDHDETIEFYKTIGYKVLETGTDPTKFTLLTDGVINLLISQDQMSYTGLIYFDEDQSSRVKDLEEGGISFFWKDEKEGGSIKQAMFEVIPETFGVNLVSHGYSDKNKPKGKSIIPLGHMGEFTIPVKDYDKIAASLKSLGFEGTKNSEPYNWGIMYDGFVPLGLHQTDDIRMNTLTYFSSDSQEVLQDLKSKGIDVHFFNDNSGRLTAPDGQDILIFQGEEAIIKKMEEMVSKL